MFPNLRDRSRKRKAAPTLRPPRFNPRALVRILRVSQIRSRFFRELRYKNGIFRASDLWINSTGTRVVVHVLLSCPANTIGPQMLHRPPSRSLSFGLIYGRDICDVDLTLPNSYSIMVAL